MQQQHDDLTPRDIAAEGRVDDSTVRRWISSGQLPAYRVGRGLRVRRTDWDAFRKPAAPEPPPGADYAAWLREQLEAAPPITEASARRIARLLARAEAVAS